MLDILNKLNRIITENELYELFKDVKFPNSGNSNFFDKNILLVATGGVLTNYEIKVEGVVGLHIRLLLFLKLSGHIGNIPQGNGEYSYLSNLHSFISEIMILKNNDISRIDEIDNNLLDKYIENNIEIKKYSNTHIKRKILNFIEYIDYEINLPYFLQVNEEILSSQKYKELEKNAEIESRDKVNGIGARQTYPLADLKNIISDSIRYIESYSYECLEAAKLYQSVKHLNQERKYSVLYDKFKQHKIKFKEPLLKDIQNLICLTKTKYMNDGRRNLGRSVKTLPVGSLLRVVEQLEVSCISIILLMTGMRAEELTMLDRELKITQDEHFHLERIVYKTAETEDGEPLSMPIPIICKEALEILSKLAFIKDGQKKGSIILSALDYKKVQSVRPSRINNLLIRYCKRLELEVITPHQFRHAMAFLIVHIHEADGLELARMFLGHSSIIMTLQYMAHYNKEIKEAIEELTKDESEYLVGKITEQIHANKRLFGQKGNRLMPNHKFAGQQVDDFIKLMRKGLLKLIEEQKLAIIQTPVSLCIHDLSKPEDLVCQQGFNIEDIVANGPAPSRCRGANCSNAVFFEEHIEKLKENMYADVEPNLKKRLEQNTYFVEAGGFEQDPFRRIIKEYDKYKEKGA